MTIEFTYNQEQAVKGGQSQFISETGAYIGKFTAAKYTTSQNGALALEFAIETQDGLKGDYLSVYYQNKNNEPLQGGINLIQAIMGCTGVKQLSKVPHGQTFVAPELIGKPIGLMLQKVLYTKNNGQDGYRFQILCPFSAVSRKTLAEHLENRPAQRIEQLIATTKDKDDRNKTQEAYHAQHEYYASASGSSPASHQPNENYVPPQNLDDDIPW